MPEIRNYHLVTESPVRIISKCRSHSKGTLMSFLAGICIIYVFLNWIPNLLGLIFPATDLDLMATLNGVDPVAASLNRLPSTPIAVVLYGLVFNGVFRFGEALYTLTYIRSRRAEYRAISEAFGLYLKTLSVFVLQVIIVSFWTMLFIIPGIIAALNFSQAFFILADDPDKGATQVLAESKMMMSGNKMAFLRLLIYYIPYMMLAYLPVLVVTEFAVKLSVTEPFLTIAGMLCGIPVFIANGYIALGRTVFYELILNKSFGNFRYAGQDAFREFETSENSI